MQSSIRCDIILDPKEMEFLQVGMLGAGFRWSENGFSLSRNVNFKIVIINYDDVTNPFVALLLLLLLLEGIHIFRCWQ